MAQFRIELHAEVSQLRTEMRTDLAGLRAELLTWMFLFWLGTVGGTLASAFAR